MKYTVRQPAILLLEDGTIYYGKAAGKIGTATGEICFNTGMTGYQEIFTDPSYYRQIMVTTNVHIGNYGAHTDEIESDSMKIAALVCKNFTVPYFRPDAECSIQEYFEREGVVVISDVDTRAIVRHIRDKGAMNAIISSEILDVAKLKEELQKVPSMQGLELSSKVSTKEPYIVGDHEAPYRVALLDLGVKKNIVRCLAERGCYIKVFPWNSTLADMKEWEPNGFMISNGPGDPAAMPEVVKNVKEIIDADYPVFGICLGHQVISLAYDLKTYKMHNGHRGINHPVKNLATGRGEITSQNHGFVVDGKGLEGRTDLELTHLHLNDQTLAGLKVKGKQVFSVQYHPEASPGPHDSRYLFDEFIGNMKVAKEERMELAG